MASTFTFSIDGRYYYIDVECNDKGYGASAKAFDSTGFVLSQEDDHEFQSNAVADVVGQIVNAMLGDADEHSAWKE